MTDSERAALRALAEDAPVQKMSVEVLKDHDGPPECDQIMVVGPSPNDPTWKVNVLEVEWSYLRRSGSLNREEGEAMASFIAAANPAAVLALIDDIDALKFALDQKRAEYEDMKSLLLGNTRNLHLEGERAREHLRLAIDHIAALNGALEDLASLGATIAICGTKYNDAAARQALRLDKREG